MGVDIQMFVKISGKANHLDEPKLKKLAYEIASSLSTDFFFTMNPAQGVFKEKRLALQFVTPLSTSDAEDYQCPLLAGKVVMSASPDAVPVTDDEQLIEVNTYGRYYGPHYERGDWPSIRACISWLQTRIPGATVIYGGDSGADLEEASPAFLTAMDMHWALNGRRPYIRYKSPFYRARCGEPPICPLCEVKMAEMGGGSDFSFYWCDGCGAKASKHIKGTVAFARLHDDYPRFDAKGRAHEQKERT